MNGGKPDAGGNGLAKGTKAEKVKHPTCLVFFAHFAALARLLAFTNPAGCKVDRAF
jgi:hypothetical protein